MTPGPNTPLPGTWARFCLGLLGLNSILLPAVLPAVPPVTAVLLYSAVAMAGPASSAVGGMMPICIASHVLLTALPQLLLLLMAAAAAAVLLAP